MEEPRRKGGRRVWIIAAVIAGAVLVAAPFGLFGLLSHYVSSAKFELKDSPPATSDLARFAVGSLARLETPAALPATPTYAFRSRDGAETTLAAFRGKVVVVNVWAMWCAPCRTEMPTLARLAQIYEGRDLVVLPVNVDIEADKIADGRSFIDVHEPLPFYTDPAFKLPFLLPGKGKMPQTVLLDRKGRIRAAFAGEADWSSPEARALIDALLAEPA